MSKVFKIILSFLVIVEFALILRGLITFNLDRLKLRLYLYSYLLLFATSLSALIFFFSCKNIKTISTMVYVYAACLIAWSLGVTCIDCYANGDSGIIVYVMTCIAVGMLTLIRPWIFGCYLAVSGTVLFVFTAYIRGWQLYSSGFYLNFIMFLVLAAFINVHNYKLTKREYETSLNLQKLSYTDQLTNLSNRRSFDEKLADYAQKGRIFTIIFLDIDNLKQINDTYGHQHGDTCLIEVAKELKEYFSDNTFRLGGDEFCAITEKDVNEVCKIMEKINETLKINKTDLALQISAGIYSTDGLELSEDVLLKADKALYRAKNFGKGQWALYDGE